MNEEKIVVKVDPDLEDLVPGFLENRKADVDKLRKALEKTDFDILTSIGHSIKGVGGGYGFDRMSELGAAIETSAKAGDAENVKEKIEQLDDFLNRVEVEYT